MRKAVAAVLLRDRIGESFGALVTGSSEKGTYVRLITPPLKGGLCGANGASGSARRSASA